jgi:hypothetical protein
MLSLGFEPLSKNGTHESIATEAGILTYLIYWTTLSYIKYRYDLIKLLSLQKKIEIYLGNTYKYSV